MGLFDWIFKKSISVTDERAIRRAVRGGILDAGGEMDFQAYIPRRQRKRNRDAAVYARAFRRAQSEVGKVFKNGNDLPLSHPERLSAREFDIARKIIFELSDRGVFSSEHANRILDFMVRSREKGKV